MSLDTEHWSSPNGCHPDCPACEAEEERGRKRTGKPKRLSMEQRGKLARDVFNAVFDECETFTEDDVGKDLAYLLGAILDDSDKVDSHVDWSKDISVVKPYVLTILQDHYTEGHPVWKFIRL